MPEDKVAILVKRAALEFDRVANPVLAEYGLTASQYKVLKLVYMAPGRRMRAVDIERRCSMTRPTALGLIEGLEAKGFVERVQNPDDARSRLVVPTGKADSMQRELEDVGELLEAKLTAPLSSKEAAQLAKLLRKLLGPDPEAV